MPAAAPKKGKATPPTASPRSGKKAKSAKPKSATPRTRQPTTPPTPRTRQPTTPPTPRTRQPTTPPTRGQSKPTTPPTRGQSKPTTPPTRGQSKPTTPPTRPPRKSTPGTNRKSAVDSTDKQFTKYSRALLRPLVPKHNGEIWDDVTPPPAGAMGLKLDSLVVLASLADEDENVMWPKFERFLKRHAEKLINLALTTLPHYYGKRGAPKREREQMHYFIALLVMSMANFHLYLPGLDTEQKKQLLRTSKFQSDEVQELMESSEWRAVLEVLEQGARRKKKIPTGGMR
jgi:hypothetical protein